MMTGKKKGNINAMGGLEGRPTCLGDKSHAQGVMSPEVGTLEDPDEGRPVHMRKKKKKLYHSDANEGKCDSEICFKC